FAKWFHAFANEIISVIVTSERTYSIASYYNTQSAVKHEYSDALVEDGNKFVNALVDNIQALTFFMLFGKFLRHYVPIIRDMANFYLKNRDYLHERLDRIIKTRREKIEEMPVDTEMGSDMLTSLITLNTEKNTDTAKIKIVDGETFEPMPDEEIRSNLLEAFGAGSDSVKIDSMFSKSSNLSYLTSDDLLKLKYCEAIIKEALRMIPVVNMVTRHMTEECEIAGYKWAAGTLFHINISGIHSHPEVWPNPEVFDPDRFYNVDQDDKRLKNNYSLITFGGGLRICPGRKLAMSQLLFLMASVYRYYNVELVNMHEPLKIDSLTSNNVPELKVKISPRVN
ncbi:20463_t:CDS:2, partial [Cetraspora pellucida]